MKSKKLISLLCAAAMTTSAFAGMVTTASAATAPVWSFDGASTDGWEGTVMPTVKTDDGSTDSYLDFLAGTGTKCNDIAFVLPTAAQLSNDYVLEYDTFIHTGNGMGRLAQYTQLAFTGESPAADTQDYGGDYAAEASPMMEGKNCDCHSEWNAASETGWGYAGDIVSSLTNRIELQGKMLINYDGTKAPSINDGDAQIGDSKWVRVRMEVKDGKAKTTIADSNATIVDGEEFAVSASKLVQIKMAFGRADTTHFIPTTPANIKLDNIKVYDGIANAPAFSTADLRKSAVVATPIPAPEKVAGQAPKFYAPESAEQVYTADFNGASTGEIGHVETAETDAKVVVNGMKVKLGNRDSGEDAKTYAKIVSVAEGDNAVRLSADKFATNGRGPVVSLDNNIDLSDMTSGSAVMSFAVYLSKTDTNGIERLFLLDNTDNVDGNGCARDVVAVITTEDVQNEDESYKYTAGDSNIGIHVEPEQWHTITVVATAGDSPVRLFVDGQYKEDGKLAPALKVEMVGTGEGNKSYVTHLPMLAIENTKAYNEDTGEGGTVYSTALIDNVLAYYVQGDLEPKNLPQTDGADPTPAPATPTPQPKHDVTVTWNKTAKKATVTAGDGETEAFDGVLIHASYDNKGTMTSVTTYDAKNITTDGIEVAIPEADVVHTGDKLMVWNSMKDMIPYGMAVVEDGEAPVVKYSVKVADTQNGTVTVTPSGNVDANTEVTITATPDEGYEVDTITVKDADNGDVAVADNKFTVVDKDVTVTVTFKEVSEETQAPETPKPADKYAVTVAAAENGTVTTDKTEAAEGETVTLTVKPNMGYEGTVTVKDADNGDVTVTNNTFTMPAKAVNVTAAFTARTDVVLSKDATYISRNGKNDNNENDVQTQVTTNYNNAETLLAGLQGNYNAMALYKFDAPTIPADKEIASAKLTFTVAKMNNINGDSSIDVNYPDVSTGIDFSAITWMTVFTQDTMTAPTESVWTHVQETAPFKSVTKLATINLARAETNVTHSDVDVTPYVKAQTKKGEEMVLVLNQCSRGANLNRVAMIEYTLQDKTYTANVTAPAETDGTLTVDKTAYNKDETVTITATATPGKKVASVTVMNGETPVNVTPGENGTYTFTMPEADVTVSATYARADVASLEITGADTVANNTNDNTYTVAAKAADGTVLTLTDEEVVAFTIAGKGDPATVIDAGTTFTGNVLTVADTQAAGAATITATLGAVTATKDINIVRVPVYTITNAADLTGGSVAASANKAIENAEVTVTPTAAAGYHVDTVTYTPAEGSAQTITAVDGVYKFIMPADNVTVSATFAKTDYAITNATAADAGGTITVAATAQMGDEVTITVTPETGKELAALTWKAESAAEATAITAAEGVYKFTMPAEAVTVTATFQKEALVRPVVSGVDVISTYDTTAVRVGDRNVLQAPTGNYDFEITSAATQVVTYDTDFLVSDGEVLNMTFGRSSSGNFGGQSSTLIITGANGAITMQGQNGSSSFTGLTWTGDAPTLTSGTWYRLTVASKANGTIWDGAAVAVYAVDADTCEIGNKLGEGTLSFRTGGNQADWNRIQYGATGKPSIDNTYVYKPTNYTAEVTVVDGEGTAVEGATVKLNDLKNSTATTGADGKVTFNVPAGEYTVTVEKLAYNAPAEAQKITVTADGGAKTVTMSAISQVLTSVDIKGGAANQTVLTKSTDTVVAKLAAVGYDADSDEMATQPTINWTSSSENTTVANGVVTVKSTQEAGTVTITATAADTAISDTYTFTVAATGTETVVLATEDFEDDVNNFVLTNGASVGTFKDSKVLKLGGTDGATATMTLDTPVTAVTGDTVKVTWTAYNGWLSSGADTVWTLKNSADEVVLSYTYNTGSCNITAVTLAGVAQEVTAFNFQQNGSKQNGWGSFSYANQNSVELTLNADGSATVVFKKGTTTAGTYTVEAANTQLTNKDIKSAEMLNHALNDDRSGGFDNFTTTITRAE